MRISQSLAKHGVRIFGPPPTRGAPKIDAWRYVRRLYLRLLPFTIPAYVLASVYGVTWLWIVLGVGALMWLRGFVSVNLRIKRLRNVPPDG